MVRFYLRIFYVSPIASNPVAITHIFVLNDQGRVASSPHRQDCSLLTAKCIFFRMHMQVGECGLWVNAGFHCPFRGVTVVVPEVWVVFVIFGRILKSILSGEIDDT